MVEVKVAKNRVQPANSLQAKCFVSWVMTGSKLVAVPDFSLLHDFCHGLLVEGASVGLVSRRATPEKGPVGAPFSRSSAGV